MKTVGRNALIGGVVLATGLSLLGTANAWYGDPWNRPYGSGAMTYERQNMMRDHAWAMQDLAAMFEGRRAFDREEAVRLANEIEKGLGDSLIGQYAPGAVVAGSRTAPWTWRNFGAFRGYAEAARQSSARLAEALAKKPGGQEQQGTWMAQGGPGYGRPGYRQGELISLEAIQEYSRLNATCHSCHLSFRGRRW